MRRQAATSPHQVRDTEGASPERQREPGAAFHRQKECQRPCPQNLRAGSQQAPRGLSCGPPRQAVQNYRGQMRSHRRQSAQQTETRDPALRTQRNRHAPKPEGYVRQPQSNHPEAPRNTRAVWTASIFPNHLPRATRRTPPMTHQARLQRAHHRKSLDIDSVCPAPLSLSSSAPFARDCHRRQA